MPKIKPIEVLENELLQNSTIDDMQVATRTDNESDKQLSADMVRYDISVLARYLIRVYVGWPVHDDIIKRKVLNRLISIYKSAHDMMASELFDSIKEIVKYIPDNHFSMRFNRVQEKTHSKRKHKDVGTNFVGDQKIKTELDKGNIAKIGFSAMLKTDDIAQAILNFQDIILPHSNALIIDLRGNGGGNSFLSDKFAYFLCGTYVDSAKEIYVRTTPEAKKIQQECLPDAGWSNILQSEKLKRWKNGKSFKINKKSAYMKPIFILIDERTCSSAEMFLLRMVHHPMVTVIGDNSRGMEVYGNTARVCLPNSNITMSIGMNYRILEYDNFELHGYTPNIKCKEGVDAMDIAILELKKANKRNKENIVKYSRRLKSYQKGMYMRSFLSKGAHSTVFIDDKSGVVIKESNDTKKDSGWFHRQIHGYEIINSIKAHNIDIGVQLPELVEAANLGDKQVIKEKIIPGKSFDVQTYLSLSEEQKNNVAQQIAIFLNAMHSSYTCETATSSIKNMYSGSRCTLNNAEDIIAKFDGKLPDFIVNRLKQAEQYLLTTDMSDEVIVMTHKDLRTQNIMYDESTQQIAVIDFELAGLDNVYRDFIAYSPDSTPWDFTKRVIEFYNKIPNKKYSITINPEKVQNMLFYGVMYTFARCIKPEDIKNATEKDNNDLIKTLEIVTGIHFDKQAIFEKAIKKLPKTKKYNIHDLGHDI